MSKLVFNLILSEWFDTYLPLIMGKFFAWFGILTVLCYRVMYQRMPIVNYLPKQKIFILCVCE